MQGNFSYHNPTKLYFGDDSLNYLKDDSPNSAAKLHNKKSDASRTETLTDKCFERTHRG